MGLGEIIDGSLVYALRFDFGQIGQELMEGGEYRWWVAFYQALGGHSTVELCDGYVAPVVGATWADYLRELGKSLHAGFVHRHVWAALHRPELCHSAQVLVFSSENSSMPFASVNLWTGQSMWLS